MYKKTTDKQLKSLLKRGEVLRHAVGNGLYFRVSSSKKGSWVVRYNSFNKRREITLGSYPEITLSDAVAEAARLKEDVKQQLDPLVERKRVDIDSFNTVDDLARDWLDDCSKRLKFPDIPKRIYRKDIKPSLGPIPLTQVTPLDVRECINKIVNSNRPSIANDALMYCKQMFRHGLKLNLLHSNPADAFTLSDAGGIEKSRSRCLSLEEIDLLFDCFDTYSEQFSRENTLAAALLITLGVRKGELIAAEWDEFKFEEKLWDIPVTRSKTGTAICIPLPHITLEWFRELHVRANGSKFVFPKRRSSKRYGHMSPDTLNVAIMKLCREKKLTIPHFTVHDFRRTCRSLMARQGVAGHVAERCLNHKLKGVEGIYDRYDYLDERRDALEEVARLLSPLINKNKSLLQFS